MSPFLFFLFLLFVTPALARSRHVIPLPSPDLDPSFLAWDPTLQHFLIGSHRQPLISSISDAGVIQTLTSPSDPTAATSSVSALAVDVSRRRLIVAFSSSSLVTISAFDLRSLVPHRLIFSSVLPSPSTAAGVAVDLATGTAFVTASDQILSVDLQGNISVLAHVSGADLGGLAHVSRGFLLVVERSKGEILKVDDEDGTVRRVMLTSSAVATAAETVAVRRDGAAVVAGGAAARWLTSKDGWSACAVFDEFRVKEEEGERVGGVAVRERSFYVLVREEVGSRIEEVEWEREGEGEMVWLMVLVGLGMAYFMYWRLQMGKLVASINKKRE